MLSKRGLLSLWLLLVAAQAGLASLPWTWVQYNFGQTTKNLTLSGFDSYAILTGQVLLGLAAWAAVAVSRAVVRRVVSWLLVLISGFLCFSNLSLLRSNLTDAVPAKANALVEKASGIAGGGPGGISAAISDHANTGTFAVLFVLASMLLLVVQLLIALNSKSWAAGEKRDKYAVGAAAPATSSTGETTKPAKNKTKSSTEKTNKTGKAKKPAKGDNIALWDSQR